MDASSGTLAPPRKTGFAWLADPAPREAPWLALALALLAALPFLVTRYPQLTDYPSHLARYHVMLDIAKNPWLARYYGFEWRLTGNLGADLLMWPLGRLLGVEAAGRLVGLIIPPLTGLGLIAVEWTLRRRIGVGTLLALTLIWSPAMGMGFYNFCLSLALALLAFALWVRLERWRWRWAVFMPIGVAVWACHVSGWGILGVLVFGYEWHRRKDASALLAPWPLTLPFALLLASGEAGGGAKPYGPHFWIYKQAILLGAMRVQSPLLDIVTPIVLLAVIGAALAARRIDGRLGWAALMMAVLVIAVPRHLGGGDYADYRLIPVVLMLGCLAIAWRAPRWLVWLAPALFVVRLAFATAAWLTHERVLERDLGALAYIPEGARVAGAVVVEVRGWSLNPFEHAPSYAAVRRDALVNSHFAIPGVHLLRLREPLPGFIDPSQRIMHRPGAPIDLAALKPARYADYLWYFGWERPATMPKGARVLYRTGHSFLALLANRADAR